MNLNTIEQELAKKFKSMSYFEYIAFIQKLDKLYSNQHKKTINIDDKGNVWIKEDNQLEGNNE